MEKINERELTRNYIKKYKIDNIFDKKILKNIDLFKFFQDELIYDPGENIEYIYFLVKGKLKILFNLSNGKRLLLRFSNPLSIIGDIEIYGDLRVKTEVSPVNSAYLLGLPLRIIKEKCYEN